MRKSEQNIAGGMITTFVGFAPFAIVSYDLLQNRQSDPKIVMILIVLGAIIIAGIALIIDGIRHPSPPPQILAPLNKDGFTWQNDNFTDDSLIISLPNAGNKYPLEISLGIISANICFAMAFGLLLLNSNTENNEEYVLVSIVVVALTLLGVFLGWVQTRRSIAERSLFLGSKGKEFVVANDGLRISIALFEGQGRDVLRIGKKSHLSLSWDAIKEFTVLPAKVRGRRHIPPYLKIKTTEPMQEYFVLRRHLHRHETEILRRCRQHLKCAIVIEDEDFHFTAN